MHQRLPTGVSYVLPCAARFFMSHLIVNNCKGGKHHDGQMGFMGIFFGGLQRLN